VLNISEN